MAISTRNGIDIYYEKNGQGPAMVLIHAIPLDHHMWIYQNAHFSRYYTTIAMDIRALGQSEKPRTPCTLRDMGDDIMGMLADEGITSDAVVMGCSIGSKLALLLGAQHPDVFRAAIAVGGTSERQGHFEHRIKAYREHQAAGTLATYHLGHLRHGVCEPWADSPIGRYLINGFLDRGRTIDAEALVHLFNVLQTSDVTADLAQCKIPMLIINGEHDSALGGGRRTKELFEWIDHEVLANTGHCCMLEDPEGFDRLVIDFLAKHGLWRGN